MFCAIFNFQTRSSVLDNKILYYDNTMQKIYSIDTENGIAKLVSNL